MRRGSGKALAALVVLVLVIVLPLVGVLLPVGKGGRVVPFIVKKGTRMSLIAHGLKKDHLIFSEYLFLSCSLVLFGGRVVAGEYDLSSDVSTLDIVRKMARGERRVYTLKIVEGYNVYTIDEAIAKAGIMDGPAFLRLAHDKAFLGRLGIPSDSLEGYLFPDTYFFSRETGPDEFLGKIVERTFGFFGREDIRKRMQELHMDMFQVLTLASIIEKEAKLESEKRLISGVFHNRLRDGMCLDADPTVIYGLASFSRELTKADLAAETPYNTYRLKGLPKGPICSPSKSSIMAALYPEATGALYFVSKNDGSHVFSNTIREHNRFVAQYQKNKGRKQR